MPSLKRKSPKRSKRPSPKRRLSGGAAAKTISKQLDQFLAAVVEGLSVTERHEILILYAKDENAALARIKKILRKDIDALVKLDAIEAPAPADKPVRSPRSPRTLRPSRPSGSVTSTEIHHYHHAHPAYAYPMYHTTHHHHCDRCAHRSPDKSKHESSNVAAVVGITAALGVTALLGALYYWWTTPSSKEKLLDIASRRVIDKLLAVPKH